MQMGIISYQAKKDTIEMGLIDYKTDAEVPAMLITWYKDEKNNWSDPRIGLSHEDASRVGELGKIFSALDKLKGKNKNAIKDPAALIHLLQKQLGRHVFWTGSKWEIVPKNSKENQWTDPVLGLKITANDEESARIKLQKELGVTMAEHMDKMDDYVAWAKKGYKITEMKNAVSNIIPLTVYSRNAKKETQNGKA